MDLGGDCTGLGEALLNLKTSISIQKRHCYTRNLNAETSGNSTTRFYVVEMFQVYGRTRWA